MILTERRYLFHTSSGPFLQPTFALHTTAIGCVACTHACLALAEHEVHSQGNVEAVANGFHGLHDYAASNWLEHVRDVAVSSSGLPQNADDPLHKLLVKTHGRADRLQTPLEGTEAKATLDHVLAKKLTCFAAIRPLYLMAQCVWKHEQDGEAAEDCSKHCLNRSVSGRVY